MRDKKLIALTNLQRGPYEHHRVALNHKAIEALGLKEGDDRIIVSQVDGGLLLEPVDFDVMTKEQLVELMRLPVKRGPKPGYKRAKASDKGSD